MTADNMKSQWKRLNTLLKKTQKRLRCLLRGLVAPKIIKRCFKETFLKYKNHYLLKEYVRLQL